MSRMSPSASNSVKRSMAFRNGSCFESWYASAMASYWAKCLRRYGTRARPMLFVSVPNQISRFGAW